jgi:glycerol kinase
MRGAGLTFEPKLEEENRKARLLGWRSAVNSVVTPHEAGAKIGGD